MPPAHQGPTVHSGLTGRRVQTERWGQQRPPALQAHPAHPAHRVHLVRRVSWELPERRAQTSAPQRPPPPECQQALPGWPEPLSRPESQPTLVQREWQASPEPTARPAHPAPGRQAAPASSAGPVCRRWTLCSLLLLSLVNSAGELWNRCGQVIPAATVVRHEDHSVRRLRAHHDSWWARVPSADGSSGNRCLDRVTTEVEARGRAEPTAPPGAASRKRTTPPWGQRHRGTMPGTYGGIHVTWTSSETITTSRDRIADVCPMSRMNREFTPLSLGPRRSNSPAVIKCR